MMNIRLFVNVCNPPDRSGRIACGKRNFGQFSVDIVRAGKHGVDHGIQKRVVLPQIAVFAVRKRVARIVRFCADRCVRKDRAV